MKSSSEKNKPNRLLRGTIIVSLGLHLILFFHISGIYESRAVSYIELTMQDFSKPTGRSIPRPRVRQNQPEVRNVKKLNIKPRHIPRIKVDTVDNNLADSLIENISTTDIAGCSGMNISDYNSDFFTANDYFEMVRIKIEKKKKYPESAKSSHLEGRVKLRFVITGDGEVSSLKVIKGSMHKSLDLAALKAVEQAAPFPRPSAKLFKELLQIEITILFELT